MDVIYQDHYIFVCVKPPGVLSTDEAGGIPSLVREYLEDSQACVRTVHRLDRTVGGLMVLARTRAAASLLGRQVQAGGMGKEYLAVVHGTPPESSGRFCDLLLRDKAERKTYVAAKPGKDVQQAELEYTAVGSRDGLTLVKVRLITGRTHQIRAQFSSRGLPLLGDRKYGLTEDDCGIALWSCRLEFDHPFSGQPMVFEKSPPDEYPWNVF